MPKSEEIQLRKNDGALIFLFDIKLAFEQFFQDPEIWKISWTASTGERIRIVKGNEGEAGAVYRCYSFMTGGLMRGGFDFLNNP